MSMINSRNNNSQPIHHRHPSIVADVISDNPGNGNWKFVTILFIYHNFLFAIKWATDLRKFRF